VYQSQAEAQEGRAALSSCDVMTAAVFASVRMMNLLLIS
jgi:hypothetical protein